LGFDKKKLCKNQENQITVFYTPCNYDFLGVENGNQCFCGNELNLNTSRKSSDETICQEYNCPENNLEFCGGVRAIAVYDTASQNTNGEFGKHLIFVYLYLKN
jgi:hypothetical protein